MKNYSKSVIYTIKTDSGIYVGSSCNFSKRKSAHKQIVKNNWFKDRLLYKNIRENDKQYTIEIFKMYPCNNHVELFTEEQRIYKLLNPNLNTYECKNNVNDILTCDCGTTVRRDNYRRHLKSDKHIHFLINQEKQKMEKEDCKAFFDIAGNFVKEINKDKKISEIFLSKKNVYIDPPPSIASDTDSDSEIEIDSDSDCEINIQFCDISSNT